MWTVASVAQGVGEFGMVLGLFLPDERKLMMEHVAMDVPRSESNGIAVLAAFFLSELIEVVAEGLVFGFVYLGL